MHRPHRQFARTRALLLTPVVAAAGLVGVVGTVGLGAHAAGASQPAATSATSQLRVTMPDGTSLAAAVSGQAPLTARPTVVEFTPYGANGGSFTVGPAYNYLLVQDRGTGDSDGQWDALGPQTQSDVVATLKWACAQQWSNGSLALAGFSASAITIFNSLHLQLPCVKAAILRSGTFDLYRDLLVPGGVPNTIPGAAVLFGIGGLALTQEQQRMQRDAASNLDLFLGLAKSGIGAGLANLTENSFWQQRRFTGDVNHLPTLLIDGAFDVEPRGDYQAFEQLRAEGLDPHLLVVGGHDGAPAGTDNGVGEIDKWLDHYLLGVDNGVTSEPAVQMLIADGDREDMLAGKYVSLSATDYPLPGTTWTPLALSPARSGCCHSLNDGSLGLTAPAATSTQSYLAFTSLPTNSDPNVIATIAGGNGGALNQLATYVPALTNMDLTNLTGLTYTTAPLRQAVTSVGPADLDLRLASLTPTTNIWAVISDVAPDGTSHPMAVGRLNTAFPDIVPSASRYSGGQLVQPYGDYGTTSIARFGQSRLYHVELWPVSDRFEAGHRIQLSIIGQSALSMPGPPSINSVTIGGTSGSRLMFPVAPGSDLATALAG